MIYRQLGDTGIRISVVAFGGMRFFERDEETAIATVRRCLEVGITFFETGSYGDGKSEALLGKALTQCASRDEIVLANKAHASTLPDGSEVRRRLEEALAREQTEYFDLFSFWGTNTPEMFQNVMKPGGPLDAVRRAQEEGLVRAIGLTTHARQGWILEFARAHHWDAITLKEHMLYSRQQDVIQALGEMGTGVIVMSPLAGGVVCSPGPDIAGKLAEAGTTAAILGLRFLVSNPHVTAVISGMTQPAEVEENARAGDVEGPLTDAEQGLLALIQERTRGLGQTFCTSCGYCVPCPEEVNIPGIFRLWNLMRGYGSEGYSKLEYQKIREQRHWADFLGQSAEACVECGTCEEKCPEGLEIAEDLKRAHADLTANWP